MAFETLIGVAGLQDLMRTVTPPVVCDCRFDLQDAQAGRRAYLAGHLAGAQFADLNSDLASPVTAQSGRHPLPDPDQLAVTLGSWGIGANTQVVVYDQANGAFAARLWWLLRWIGHRAVALLDGGFSAWLSCGGAVRSGVEVLPGGSPYPARLQPHLSVSAEEILRLLRSQGCLLVDARAPERYAGTVEPIDAIAGHVPGALNAPFSASLSAEGRILPRAQLETLWRRRLGSRSPAEVVAMCGSGVTACHDLLTLEIAGLTGARLYPGSWSEWIKDPTRPVSKGPSA